MKYKPKTFAVGEKVLVSTKYLRQRRLARKFSNKFISPFLIVRVLNTGLAYKLNLPKKYRIYYIFPISVLEESPYYEGESPLPEEPDLIEPDKYKVERILAYKGPLRRR